MLDATIRQQVWSGLCNLKFKGYVLSFLVERFQKWDRSINIFLAVASSTSIAAWAVWKVEPMIWAGIIAFSQLVTVTKPYFPYYKYVKELNSKLLRIENLNLEFEKLWNNIQRNKISEDASEELYYDIKKQMNDIFNFSDETILSIGKATTDKANEKMKIFLESNYGIV